MAKQVKITTPAPVVFQDVTNNFQTAGNYNYRVWEHGYEVYVDKSMYCPCRDKNGSPLNTCQNCGGTGTFFFNRKETKMLIQAINSDFKFRPYSMEEVGMIKISTMNVDRLSYGDRVMMKNIQSLLSETVHLFKKNGKLYGRFSYEIIDIEEVFLFKSEAEPLIRLTSDDLTITENIVEFPFEYASLLEPTAAIRYNHRPAFHVVDIARENVYLKAGTNEIPTKRERLPLLYIAKRAHKIEEKINIGVSQIDNSYDIE